MSDDAPASAEAAARRGGRSGGTPTICNQRGLHARAAAKFVKLAALFDAEVTVRKDDTRCPAARSWG